MAGATTVTVFGLWFINTGELYCKFGTQEIAGSWISDTRVECRSPAVGAAGSVALEVSNNNQDFTSDGVTFTYQLNAAVSSLSLSSGPQGKIMIASFCSVTAYLTVCSLCSDGLTVVTVTGANFVSSPNLNCRFDLLRVNASYVTASTIVCITPAHAVGNVTCEVTNNGQDFTTNGVVFDYQRMCPALCLHYQVRV